VIPWATDADIWTRRMDEYRRLPWILPALTVLEFTSEDLDHLATALVDNEDRDEWWLIVCGVVRRVEQARTEAE
jgi:hypothetical protein